MRAEGPLQSCTPLMTPGIYNANVEIDDSRCSAVFSFIHIHGKDYKQRRKCVWFDSLQPAAVFVLFPPAVSGQEGLDWLAAPCRGKNEPRRSVWTVSGPTQPTAKLFPIGTLIKFCHIGNFWVDPRCVSSAIFTLSLPPKSNPSQAVACTQMFKKSTEMLIYLRMWKISIMTNTNLSVT